MTYLFGQVQFSDVYQVFFTSFIYRDQAYELLHKAWEAAIQGRSQSFASETDTETMNDDISEEYNDYSNEYSTEYEDDYEYSDEEDELSRSETGESDYGVTQQTDSESRRPVDGRSKGESFLTGESTSGSESLEDTEEKDEDTSGGDLKVRGHANGEPVEEDDMGNTAMSAEGTTSGEGPELSEEVNMPVQTNSNDNKSTKNDNGTKAKLYAHSHPFFNSSLELKGLPLTMTVRREQDFHRGGHTTIRMNTKLQAHLTKVCF